jgi:hypothetical protein
MEVYLHFGARLRDVMLDIVSFTGSLILHSDTGLCTVLRLNTGLTRAPETSAMN